LFFRLATLGGGMMTCSAWSARRCACLLDNIFIGIDVFHVPALSMTAKKNGRSGSGETICSWIFRSHRNASGFTRNADLSSMAKRMLQEQRSLVF
jgi:hypothetical protein